jgi:hypothetical protein
VVERRRGAAGRDRVDHAPGAHDDRANSAAGVASLLGADDFARQGRGPLDPAAAERAPLQRSAELMAERLRCGGGSWIPSRDG